MKLIEIYLAEKPISDIVKQQDLALDEIMNKFHRIKIKQNATRKFEKWMNKKMTDLNNDIRASK